MFGNPAPGLRPITEEAPPRPARGASSAPATPSEAQREAEMFGAPSEGPTAEGSPAPSPPSSAETSIEMRLDGGAQAAAAESLADRLGAGVLRNNDFLDIGGFLFLLAEWDVLHGGDIDTWPLTSPNLMDLYFDARPSDRVRGYFRGRATYNPTVTGTSFNLMTLTPQQQTGLLLDQFWIKFDAFHRLFITVGRQPIRWGAGRFWNPTDFLNKSRRDPLAIFDQRVGVTLVKLNVPIESEGWNFYALVDVSNVSSADYLGGALRAEILIDQTELIFTAAKKKSGPLQLGLDASAGLGLFDLKLEVAVSQNVQQRFYSGPVVNGLPQSTYLDTSRWFVQVVGGTEVSIRYSDEDAIALGVEYFYNQLGYDNPDYYMPVFFDFEGRGLTPPFLYLGRHYAAAYAMLAKPGSWNSTTVTGSLLTNLSDKSAMARLDYQVRVLTYLDINFYTVYHFGNEGELRLGFNIPAGVIAQLKAGYARNPPMVDIGGGLRLYF